jgi:hypothetical protein
MALRYVRRRGTSNAAGSRNDLAEARLVAGTHAHRRLGQRTDDLQLAAMLQRVLLFAIVLMIAGLAVHFLGVPTPVP